MSMTLAACPPRVCVAMWSASVCGVGMRAAYQSMNRPLGPRQAMARGVADLRKSRR